MKPRRKMRTPLPPAFVTVGQRDLAARLNARADREPDPAQAALLRDYAKRVLLAHGWPTHVRASFMGEAEAAVSA